MKHLIPFALFLLLFCPLMSYEAGVKTLTIYFAKDKAWFNAGEAQKLNALKSADFVSLKAHTDNDGSDDYNMDLSKRRLEAVKNYILNLDAGINIETDYYGERSPLNQNADENEKTKNRRVEITYISDPLLRTKVQHQVYEIDNTQGKEIVCQHGTKVIIPAGAFGNKKVKITVSEYYTPSEILAANLTTKSGNRPIETAGMLNVTAEVDGQPVQPVKALQYKFPRKNKSEDYELFMGKWDEERNVDWKVEKTEPTTATTFATREASAELVGWDSCEDIRAAAFSTYLSGKGIDSFWHQRNIASRNLQQGCLVNGTAYIALDNTGKIISIKTNYDEKNVGWARDIKNFVRDNFPKEIETHGVGASVILKFGNYNTANIKAVPTGYSIGWDMPAIPFGKEYAADYETDNIVLSTSKMGWINCDRFYSNPNLSTYKIITDSGCNVRLLMTKYRSFFANEFQNGESNLHEEHNKEYGFYRIPTGEEAVLISTKKVDGTIYLAIEKTKISAKPFTNFNYKPVTQTELEIAIRDLAL